MRFSPWFPASEIDARAPSRAGVFQVRTAEVRAYPRGRSAMAHYGAAEDLQAAMHRFAGAQHDPTLLYRFADDLDGRSSADVLERLLQRFIDRFGAEPSSP